MTWFGKLKGIGSQIDSIAQPNRSEDEVKDQIINELVETVEQESKTKEESNDYYRDTITPMVLDAEQALRDSVSDTMTQLEVDHQGQVDGYEFSCIRHGDFLTVFMTRKYNATYKDMGFPEELTRTKLTETINLNRVERIILEKGHPPDLNGVVTYDIGKVREGLVDESIGYLPFDSVNSRVQPGVGYKHVILPITSTNLYPRKLTSEVVTPQYSYDRSRYRYRDNYLDHETKDMPRLGVDDEIIFRGLDIAICVPAGLGEMVEAKILEALGRGFESKGIAASLQE